MDFIAINIIRSSNIFSALHLLHRNCTHLFRMRALVVAGAPVSTANPEWANRRSVVIVTKAGVVCVKTPTTTNHLFGGKPMLQKLDLVGDPTDNCPLTACY